MTGRSWSEYLLVGLRRAGIAARHAAPHLGMPAHLDDGDAVHLWMAEVRPPASRLPTLWGEYVRMAFRPGHEPAPSWWRSSLTDVRGGLVLLYTDPYPAPLKTSIARGLSLAASGAILVATGAGDGVRREALAW